MIHIKPSNDGNYYVVVKADNGRVLSQTETLKNKADCYKNIKSLKKQLIKGLIIDDTK